MSNTPQSTTKAWVFLFIAAILEIIFALSTNATEGFTRLVPSIITVVAVSVGIYFLTKALKTLDVGVGYTIWTGIGSIGTVVLGAVIFGESLSLGKVGALALIIGGIVGLHQFDRKSKNIAEPVEQDVSMAVRCGPTVADWVKK